jgi:hypothetical protein
VPNHQSISAQQQALYPHPGSTQGDAFGGLGGVFSGLSALTLNVNNPDHFKENMKIVQTHIKHIKTLTSAAQLGMYDRFWFS